MGFLRGLLLLWNLIDGLPWCPTSCFYCWAPGLSFDLENCRLCGGEARMWGGLNKLLSQKVKTSQQVSFLLPDSWLLSNIEHDLRIWSLSTQNQIRQGLDSILAAIFFSEQRYTTVKPLKVTHKVAHYIKSYCIQIPNKSKTSEVTAIKDWDFILLEML